MSGKCLSRLIQSSAVLLMACSAFGTGPAEPPPDTDTTVRALIEKSNDVDANVRRAAANDAAKLGAPAVPSLIEAYNSPNEHARVCVARALSIIGPDAKEAIVVLALGLRDDEGWVVRYSLEGLGKMGPESIPILEGAREFQRKEQDFLDLFPKELEDALASARSLKTAETLDELIASLGTDELTGNRDDTSVPATTRDASLEANTTLESGENPYAVRTSTLIAALKDTREGVRIDAAKALRSRAPQAKETVSALIESLSDESPEVQRIVCGALAAFGPDSYVAVPNLVALLNQSGEAFKQKPESWEEDRARARKLEVGAAAAEALEKIGPGAKDAVPVLMTLLADEYANPEEAEVYQPQLYAAKTLGGIGPEAASALPALVHLLDTGDDEVQRQVADTLGR
ncbi:MAG: HEAT repeat domain-containing protein, partial [Candidatus Hydrogenedentales bacterium]